LSAPLTIFNPDKGTDPTIVPLRRQIEQLHLRGSTMPSGN